ncbi:MAG: SMP-30/gluconolactonase/LRE family protein [Massilia sp.]
MNNIQPTCLWPVAAHLGEGPIWHAPSRSVFFVDIKKHLVHRCNEDGGERQSWQAPQQVGFIVPLAGGDFVCGGEDGLYKFSPASGAFTRIRAIESELTGNRFNDGFVDAAGSLWFGSMDNSESEPTGSLYRIGTGGALERLDRDYIISNGPTLSPDGKTLYHTDTRRRTIYAFDALDDGSLARKRVFVVPAAPGNPDGMAVDAEGVLWVTMFRGARIDRYTPDGALIDSVAFPVPNITKLAFGGDDLRTVYVTTAWKGMSEQELAEWPLAGGLFTFRSPTPGLPHNVCTDAVEG